MIEKDDRSMVTIPPEKMQKYVSQEKWISFKNEVQKKNLISGKMI